MPRKPNSSDYQHSMDELMIRTIGLIETIPDRLTKLETLVHGLAQRFAKHEGEQEQGIKRTTDRFRLVEKNLQELKDLFENCQRHRIDPSICTTIEELSQKLKELEENLKPLVEDLDGRISTRKSIKDYIQMFVHSCMRYFALPIVILIMLFFGINPSYIPWYKADKTMTVYRTSDSVKEFWKRVYLDKIAEHDIYYIVNAYRNNIILSYKQSEEDAKLEYRRQSFTINMQNKEHLFIWLPRKSQEGYVQVFDGNARPVGKHIKIERGI